jgi:isocitrate dehydrogenase
MERGYREKEGDFVRWAEDGSPLVPDEPIIPFIEGDGTGPDIWAAARPVLDAAVKAAYGQRRRIRWMEVLAGEKALNQAGDLLPEATLEALAKYGISIKGPLTTPVGKGFRSVNVAIRQKLDLYACVRPVRYIPGVPSPVKHPELVNLVIFRENTEDLYAGIEWPAGSSEARKVIGLVNDMVLAQGGSPISPESAVGIKPMSEANTRRLVRRAVLYALENGYRSVTLVHKGNIMKYTEGGFRDWGYRTALEEFPASVVREADLQAGVPDQRLVIKDRIADAMFQQLLLRPEEYGVIATPNLNGDYLSDAAAAQVGGLGMAPGWNMGDRCAVFEATHGSAPRYAGLDKVNPGSVILSGAEMLRFMGWKEASELVFAALARTIADRIVTYDLARQMEGAREVKCSQFGCAVIERMRPL